MLIGVDLGGTNARAALVDKGRIIETYQQKLSDKYSLEGTLEQLFSIIAPLTQYNIKGIGVGVPSVVDAERGIVYDVVNIPSWINVELKQILQDKFNLPVFINNDVNCLALGEQQYGQASPYENFVAIGIGTGLGAAIVIDRKLYTGMLCGSGEIGYIPYLDKNLEFYSSGMYFETFSTSAQAAYLAALSGDSDALGIWNQYGYHLGQVMKVIMYTYAPEAILVGGGISNAFPFFESSMHQSLSDFVFPKMLKKVKILRSNLENIAILGAAALVPL
jgi:glucokinase